MGIKWLAPTPHSYNDDGDGIIWFDKQNDDFNKFDILDGAETWLAFKI